MIYMTTILLIKCSRGLESLLSQKLKSKYGIKCQETVGEFDILAKLEHACPTDTMISAILGMPEVRKVTYLQCIPASIA